MDALKKKYRLVMVKLHNYTAGFRVEITWTQRFEWSAHILWFKRWMRWNYIISPFNLVLKLDYFTGSMM